MPKTRKWFFIADGAKAHLYEKLSASSELILKESWSEPEARMKTSDLSAERPSRGRTIGTGAPYTVEPASLHERAAEDFLTQHAHGINQAFDKNAFDHLTLVAPPAALGILRKHLKAEILSNASKTVDKDLTNLTEPDLKTYIAQHLS